MKIPTIHGIIERRILVNYTAEPEVVANILPKPFSPKLYRGKAIVGICLIRLKNIKPKGFPALVGISSENGAHRIAVEWEKDGMAKEGVYIPRRDTSLRLNTIIGGRLFPGKHHYAKFNVKEEVGNYHINFISADETKISIDAMETTDIETDSIFETLENASLFFERGSIGFSPNKDGLDGLKLETYKWNVKPLKTIAVKSSFFENEAVFPKGSIKFDNALLMTNIEHEWKSLESL